MNSDRDCFTTDASASAAKQSQVESDRRSLDMTLDRILGLTQTLEERLGHVLPPQPPVCDGEAKPQAMPSPVRCELAARLVGMGNIAQSIENQLNHILRNIQL